MVIFVTFTFKKVKTEIVQFSGGHFGHHLDFFMLPVVQIPNELQFLFYLMNNDHIRRINAFSDHLFKEYS